MTALITETLPALPPAVALDGEIIPPGDYSVRVVACPRPFSTKRIERQFPAGLTLEEMLVSIQPSAVHRRHAFVSINGNEINRAYWHRTRPKPGTLVNIRVAPGGGGRRQEPAPLHPDARRAGGEPGAAGGIPRSGHLRDLLGHARWPRHGARRPIDTQRGSAAPEVT